MAKMNHTDLIEPGDDVRWSEQLTSVVFFFESCKPNLVTKGPRQWEISYTVQLLTHNCQDHEKEKKVKNL